MFGMGRGAWDRIWALIVALEFMAKSIRGVEVVCRSLLELKRI